MSTGEKRLSNFIETPPKAETGEVGHFSRRIESVVAPFFDTDSGSRMETVRMKMLMSQGEVAELLGISQATMSKLERGRMEQAPFTLARLRAVFGKYVQFIFFGTGEPTQWNVGHLHRQYWRTRLKDRRKPGSGLWKTEKVRQSNEDYWKEKQAQELAKAGVKKSEKSGS